jgi:hypothetical protein
VARDLGSDHPGLRACHVFLAILEALRGRALRGWPLLGVWPLGTLNVSHC